MILSTVKKVCDAGVCEQGRIDSYAALAKHGMKDTDHINAQWCLAECGVPGTLWAMGHVFEHCQREANTKLWMFIIATLRRYSAVDTLALVLVENIAKGHKQNLAPIRELWRAAATLDGASVLSRATAQMYYQATDTSAELFDRACLVAEQAMRAAAHENGHAVPGDGWKAEYKTQYASLMKILDTELS